jgi:hypothetical protein
MAVVLIFLLIGLFRHDFAFITIAIISLIFTMAFPLIFKYIAVIWLGFSHLLGTVVSKIVLTVIFFLVVMPVGMIRQIFGYDTLKLRQFKKGTDSVMIVRNTTFSSNDIEKPF